MSTLVTQRVEEGVGVISLNRPEKHNALDNAAGEALSQALRWGAESAEVRCILLRGEGLSFCSGRDTTQLGQREPGDSDFAFVRRAQDRRLEQLDSPEPFVAAVRGACIGGGFEMALGCDLQAEALTPRHPPRRFSASSSLWRAYMRAARSAISSGTPGSRAIPAAREGSETVALA